MQRPGADPENMDAADFICDFCGASWSPQRPMVEGHRGSLICGRCLTDAYAQVITRNAGVTVPPHVACTLCLLNKSGDYWQSATHVRIEADQVIAEPAPGAVACRWCIDRSASMLAKDAESGWKRPS